RDVPDAEHGRRVDRTRRRVGCGQRDPPAARILRGGVAPRIDHAWIDPRRPARGMPGSCSIEHDAVSNLRSAVSSALRRRARVALFGAMVALAAAAAPMPASAQSMMTLCERDVPTAELDFCNTIGQAIEITQARVGIAAIGGNPTLGTSSTLGMRIGSFPRI